MVGDKMSCFDQTNYTLVASAMAISVVDVDLGQFQVLTFGVSSAAEGLSPENNPDGKILNTYVVSASVTNASGPIKDLEEDVEVTLHHLTSNPLGKEVQCVYWDFNQNEGRGGWEQHGCRKHNTSADYTTCLCDHLTHFGVLLVMSFFEMHQGWLPCKKTVHKLCSHHDVLLYATIL
uniref:Adhesion G protein-coupled receptor G4b n=1 Tax=Oncorhynchus tshawytscha TaxID=74940 RepID=A0AAZ3R2U3_ONCTS